MNQLALLLGLGSIPWDWGGHTVPLWVRSWGDVSSPGCQLMEHGCDIVQRDLLGTLGGVTIQRGQLKSPEILIAPQFSPCPPPVCS